MDDSHILFNIPDANSVNHVVVFLTGQQPLAEGMGAAGNIFSTLQFYIYFILVLPYLFYSIFIIYIILLLFYSVFQLAKFFSC